MKQWLKRNWQFVLFCVVAFGIRYVNFDKAMYFIYDVGRDSLALKAMASGDLKLVGPTTGLPGFFLGPLWYYVGLPGYWLTRGNPYGIQLWYITLASLFIPMAWVLSHKLFGNTVWAKLSALLLVLSSGSISGTNFVWNPMLSLPLLTGALLCLLQARQSKRWLYVGFFLLALMLQSEFAYGIFFVVTLWFFIPLLRGKFEWKTMLTAAVIIGMTLLPQLGFELRHHFSMTKSLLASMNNPEMKVSLRSLWQQRPKALWNATLQFVSRDTSMYQWLSLGYLVAILFGMLGTIKQKQYTFYLLAGLTLLPYGFYMIWTGNYGYFFDYYITPHFIVVIPFLIFGLKTFYEWTKNNKLLSGSLITAFLLVASLGSYQHLNAVIFRPDNRAGLAVMQQAIQTLYAWSQEDGAKPAVFRIYTPNVYTDHYDYLIAWLGNVNGYNLPLTVQNEGDTYRYLLYEPTQGDFRQTYFIPWYTQATQDMTLTRQEKVGVLTIETWQKQ